MKRDKKKKNLPFIYPDVAYLKPWIMRADLNLLHEAWLTMHSHGTCLKSHHYFLHVNPYQHSGSMTLHTIYQGLPTFINKADQTAAHNNLRENRVGCGE